MISFEYSTPRTLNASGTVAPGSEATTHYIAVAHPAYFGGFVFKETLASGGISMKGGIVCTRNCPTTVATPVEKKKDPWKTIAVYRSPKLSEIIKVVNKMSNNLYAELLLLTIGKAAGNVSGTQGATVAAISSLKSAGIDTEGLTMADGSGLSRYNLVTPRSVIQLLKVMANGPYAPQFMGSLPAMSTEGTLKNRLKGSQAVGRIRAKTGTMVHVRSLSGYITTKHDETLVFSILCNNFDVPVSTIDDVMNRIILRLLEYQGAGR